MPRSSRATVTESLYNLWELWRRVQKDCTNSMIGTNFASRQYLPDKKDVSLIPMQPVPE